MGEQQQQAAPPGTGPRAGQRIALRIARAGLCSRRQAEQWIGEGRVAVDGVTLTSPAINVTEGQSITVDGKPLPEAGRARVFRYHKPVGLIVSARDPHGRPTVFERLPAGLPRLISVGRLDFNSEGLLLLTNDGAVARLLELPANGWIRRYRARVHGAIDEAALARLADGIEIDGVRYGPIRASLEKRQRSNAWLSISLQEGKNREVRRIMEHLGLPVSRLIRVGFGPFTLGELKPGAIEEVPPANVDTQLGLKPQSRTGWARAKPKPKLRPKSRMGKKPDHAHHRR